MREKFGDLSSSTAAKANFDNFLSDKSYLSDCIPSQLDVSAYQILKTVDLTGLNLINTERYFNHIASFKNEFEFLPEAQF